MARLASLLAIAALALLPSACDSKSTGNAGPFFIDAGPRDIVVDRASDTGGTDVAADGASPDADTPDAPATDAPADAPVSDAPVSDATASDATASDATADSAPPADAVTPDVARVDALDALPTVDLGPADARDATGG